MVVTCDIGTSALKLGVINQAGVLCFYAREPLARPSARAWQRAFRRSTTRIPSELRRQLRAVSISGNGPTLVPIDKRGRPTAPPLWWYEREPAAAASKETVSYFLPNAARFAVRHPHRYDRTACFLPSGEYLAFSLTGNRAAFIPHAGYIPYYWREDETNRWLLDKDKFPSFQAIGTESGRVTRGASREYGLAEGIQVFCGGTDFLMAAVGAGAGIPGTSHDRGGTSAAVNHCSREALTSPRLRSVPGFQAGTYNASGFVPNAGRWHAWLKNRLIGRGSSYDDFAALVNTVVPGISTLRFLPPPPAAPFPHASSPLKTFFPGATEETTKGEYAWAFLEYIGFSVRLIIEELEERGASIDVLMGTGGLAKCRRLNQIKATITGKTWRIPKIVDSELMGNALVALTALKEFSSVEEAARDLVSFPAEFDPEEVPAVLYHDLFEEFKDRTSTAAGMTRS